MIAVLLAAAVVVLLALIELVYRRDLRLTATPVPPASDPAANTYAGGFPPDLDEVLASWLAGAERRAAERGLR